MKIFDAHNHIQNYPSPAEEAEAMAAAAAAGVEGMICCGTCPDDWGRVLEISGRYEGVTPAFGLHPWLQAEDGWLGRLEEFLRRCPAACVGEIGLDVLKGRPGHEEDFLAQLELAGRFHRPAVIHCVRAWGPLPGFLRRAGLPAFMLHAYGGTAGMVKELAGMGGYFSFGAELADPKREKLRSALAAVPPDRLLFESEAPEPGGPSWRAGPAGAAEAAAAAAALLGRSVEELAALSVENAARFAGRLP